MRTLIAGGIIGVAALGLVAWMLVGQSPSPMRGVLETSGRIEGDQAAVAAKVGGQIVRLSVGEGDRVDARALISELASAQVQAQLDHAEHALHTASEQLAEAEARMASTRHQADQAEIAVTLAGGPFRGPAAGGRGRDRYHPGRAGVGGADRRSRGGARGGPGAVARSRG